MQLQVMQSVLRQQHMYLIPELLDLLSRCTLLAWGEYMHYWVGVASLDGLPGW